MSDDASQFSKPAREWMAQGKYLTIGGRRIFAVEKGSGPVLFFLHGFPTSCYDWRGMMERLAPDYRCVAFDFPGYGLSGKPDDYSYSLFQQADCAEGIAAAFGIGEAHMISHDMGTSVHCELLARAERGKLGFRVRASTFTNGSMLQWLAKITPFQQMLASNETLPQAMKICAGELPGHIAALRALMKRPEAWGDEDAAVIEDLMRHADGVRRLPALAGYMRERYVHRDRWLGAIGAAQDSAQFVWADGDPIAVVEMGRELHAMFPRARYAELPGLGHFLIAEDPTAVAEKIREFEMKFNSPGDR
ncbi:alpha/beta hydrolase [Candidatus Sumerlaeota bacterium]|nr:alpha/beta hydrolase [Candidatus Sumerlaeota bacterium]